MPLLGQESLDNFYDERQRRRQETTQAPVEPIEAQERELFSFSDLAWAVPRAGEGFVRSLASLGNAVGFDFDLDNEKVFGEAETLVGGWAEGALQFSIGMLGGLGVVSRLGRLGALQSASRAIEASKASFLLPFPKFAAAGAVADFTAFDGNEENLSSLIQTAPGLANPVTEFLATDEDTGEIEGRIKNTLEGLGIGAIFDTVVAALRVHKKVRAARTADATADDLEAVRSAAAAEEEVGMDEAFRALAGEPEDLADTIDGPVLEEVAERPIASPTHLSDDDVARQELLARSTVSPEDAAQVNAVWEELREAGTGVNPRNAPEVLAERLGTKALNLDGLADGPAAAIRAHEDLFGSLGKQADVVPTAEQLEQEADYLAALMGQNPGELMENIAQTVREAPKLAQAARLQLGALTTLNRRLGVTMHEQLVKADGGDKEALANVIQISRTAADLAGTVRQLAAEQGRGLNILKQISGGGARARQAEAATAVADQLAKFGTTDDPALAELVTKLKVAYGSGDESGLVALMAVNRDTLGRRVLRATQEGYINNILGSFKTLTVNAVSGAMMSVYMPLENMVGGLVTQNGDAVRRSLREFQAMTTGVRDAAKFAWRASREGRNFIDPQNAFRDDPGRAVKAISGEAFPEAGPAVGQALNWFGQMVRFPGAVMRGTDEFVKQMNARAVVRTDLIDRGLAEGLDLPAAISRAEDQFGQIIRDGEFQTRSTVYARGVEEARSLGLSNATEVRAHAQRFLEENFDEGVTASMDRALKRANEVTFQTPIDPDSFSGHVKDVLDYHPLTRFVVPFFKTPVNILGAVSDRVPLAGATQILMSKKFGDGVLEGSKSRLVQDLMSGDSQRKAEAAGRMAAGLGFMGLGTQLALGGQITGGGPTDPEQRRALEATGWLPYSFKTENGYVQYLKMDPFATFFGTVADLSEVMRSNEGDGDDITRALAAIQVSLSRNLFNKSYLQGLSQFIDVLGGQQSAASAMVERYAGSIVPASFAQLVSVSDPHWRETNGIIEAIKARTPFLSDSVAPMRNVLGEAVDRRQAFGQDALGAWYGLFQPIAYREVKDDAINQEFAALKFGMSPPRPQRMGMDLRDFTNGRQTAYDRWSQLHGQVKINGRTLKQELTRTIRNRQYQALSPEADVSGRSPRYGALQTIVRRYRSAAHDAMLKEYPELAREMADRERERTRQRRGLRAIL